MNKKSFLIVGIGMAILGVNSPLYAEPDPISWRFEAYGGFSGLYVGEFPSPGYEVLLTPLSPRSHRDMGAFYWSELSHPAILAINQKEPLIHGQEWKAPGRYYGEKKPIQPGVTSMHGKTLHDIQTGDGMGEVIGWVTHYNNPTEQYFKDARVAVNYHLRLFDPVSNELVWYGDEMSFVIDVFETYNGDSSDFCCPDGNINSEGPNKSGCADRFRIGVLKDGDGDGFDLEDLKAAIIYDTFDIIVGDFTRDGVKYDVSLTGFWENGENGDPVLTGEGWSPEYEFIHFEVRAEVNVAGEAAPKAGTAVSTTDSCEPHE
jgi:hypothetical protein